MIEPVMEATLVLHRPRHDDVGVPGQQGVHPGLVPHRAGQLPPVIVGVDGDVAAPGELLEERRLPGARHAGDQHSRHLASVRRLRAGR